MHYLIQLHRKSAKFPINKMYLGVTPMLKAGLARVFPQTQITTLYSQIDQHREKPGQRVPQGHFLAVFSTMLSAVGPISFA